MILKLSGLNLLRQTRPFFALFFLLLSFNAAFASTSDTLCIKKLRGGRIKSEKFYLNNGLVKKTTYQYRKKYYRCYTTNEPKSKPIIREFKIYYNDGRLWSLGKLHGWKPEGIISSYYENGQPSCVCNYKNGKRDSVQLIYHDNGQLWTRWIYQNGRFMEVLESYDRTGTLEKKGTLSKGNGTVLSYDGSGKLEEVITYKKGKKTNLEKIKP